MRGRSFALLAGATVALASAIWYTAVALTGRSVTEWVMTVDASAGTVLTAANVQQVSFKEGAEDVTVVHTSPVGRRLAVGLARGNPIIPAALLDQATTPVPITFKAASPGLASGDRVDIYGPRVSAGGACGSTAPGGALSPSAGALSAAGGGIQLYGRGLVLLGDGGAIAVPAGLEGWWTEVATSGMPLTAVKSTGIGVPSGQCYTLEDAQRLLTQAADSSAGAGTTPAGAGSP